MKGDTGSKVNDPNHSTRTPSQNDFIVRLARRFNPDAVSLRAYIDEVNEANVGGRQIDLVCKQKGMNDKSYQRFLNMVDETIVWVPSTATRIPKHAVSCLPNMMNMNDLLQGVISSLLKIHKPTVATQLNVLSAGYSLSHERGTGSALRDLDVRSPSASVNLLLTKTWRAILSCLGHIVLRHLLTNATVLLATSNKQRTNSHSDQCDDGKAWVFLQLCGPQAEQRLKSFLFRLPRSDSTISIQRDICQNPYCGKRAKKRPNLPSNGKLNLINSGLPKTNHLNLLPSSLNHSVAILLGLIFSKHLGDRTHPGLETGVNGSERMGTKSPLVISEWSQQRPFRDYDKSVCHMLLKNANSSKPKIDWHKIQKRIPERIRQRLSPSLKKMVVNLRKLSFRQVLGRSCPLSSNFLPLLSSKQGGTSTLSITDLINMNTMNEDVSTFLIQSVHALFPRMIFGSAHNRKVFHRAIRELIEHRQLKENFDVIRYFSQHAFKITDVEWLHTISKGNIDHHRAAGRKVKNPTDLRFRQTCMNDFLIWMFRGFVIPLLQHNFCLTEGNLDKNRIFFYRGEVWTKLLDITNNTVLRSKGQFRILSKNELRQCVARRVSVNANLGDIMSPCSSIFYHHLMRYIPKRKSLRWIQMSQSKPLSEFDISKILNNPITKLKSKQRINGRMSLRYIQLLMNQLVSILINESRRSTSTQSQSPLGASVFSLNDIYSKWINLKNQWAQHENPQMYVCSVDITQSFDTIPLRVLLETVVPKVLSKSRYPVIRMHICKRSSLGRKFIFKRINHVCLNSGDETSLIRPVTKNILPRHAGSIVSDCASAINFDRNDIILMLKEFIANNIVVIHRRSRLRGESGFAVQVQGVPQGHPLSTILTSLFYGHVERQDLSEFLIGNTPQNTSISKDSVVKVNSVQNGHSLLSETAKYKSNRYEHEVKHEVEPSNPISLLMRQIDDTLFVSSDVDHCAKFLKRMLSGWESLHGFSVNPEKTKTSFKTLIGGTGNLKVFPWCGLLICVNTLEIRSDYSRYSCLRNHVTVEHEWESGRIWKERCLTCFYPKLHPIFVDHRINSSFTICLNVYQAAVLCYLKICSSLLALSNIRNPSLVVSVFTGAVQNFTKLVCQALRQVASVGEVSPPNLSIADVKFLTVHAVNQCVRKALLKHDRCDLGMGIVVMGELAEFLDHVRDSVSKRPGGSAMIETADKIADFECEVLWGMKL